VRKASVSNPHFWPPLNTCSCLLTSIEPWTTCAEDHRHIGLFNFAIFAGCIIGLFTAGPLSDWVSDRATAGNRGVREPEMRLPAMIPYVLIMILCNIITAVGYERDWPWQPIVILGYTCSGIQTTALPALASTYAVDSYKPVAGSLFVSITVYKNLWGYGMGKFVTPWIIQSG
jgi:MFS family permease